MRTFALLSTALVTVLAAAGCVSQPQGGDDPGDDQVMCTQRNVLNGTQDYQLAAHPDWGWPTLQDMGAVSCDWPMLAYRPLPDTISGLEHVAHVDGAPGGSGIAVWSHYVFVSGNGGGGDAYVVDVSDPSSPKIVSRATDRPGTRDADMMVFPDGRVIVVTATNTQVLPIYDMTDPTNVVKLADATTTRGSHNVAVVPGTPIVYNANSQGGGSRTAEGGTGVTEIFDLSDPSDPKLVTEFKNGFGCHDITFHINPEAGKYRAYCAGIEFTQIWNITNPLAPEVLVNVPVHHGNPALPSGELSIAAFSHLAMVNHDATVLIVGDETGGGIAPGCDFYAEVGGRTASGPIGNLWFYDITDERNPELKGWVSPESTLLPTSVLEGAGTSCTAHFGRLVEDRDMLVMAFYGQGVALVDFSDPSSPRIVDLFRGGADTWDVWYYQGYAFTGDLARGIDVLTFR